MTSDECSFVFHFTTHNEQVPYTTASMVVHLFLYSYTTTTTQLNNCKLTN